MNDLLILGAGTAGTIMAARLARALDPRRWRITVVDRDDAHVYQPGLLFVPLGLYRADELVRSRRRYIPPGVCWVMGELAGVDVDAREVRLADGRRIGWDVLVIATGAALLPERTDGLVGPGWRSRTHEFYTLEGALALQQALEGFRSGRFVVHVSELPIKCPVAPLEMALLAEAFFTERGLRQDVEVVYATPLDGAFTKPVASAALGSLLAERGIRVEPEVAVSRVDGEGGTLHTWDGREIGFDLLVTVPVHAGVEALAGSGLVDSGNWVETDRHTLQARHHADVFALGDATDVPTSKAGSVAHFQAEVLAENIVRHARGLSPRPDFDGHANCFIETGHGKAVLIDFNYETEPVPGKFPLPLLGPFELLRESRMNHWGKLGFRWVYWNLLLKGEDLPIDHRLVLAGKEL